MLLQSSKGTCRTDQCCKSCNVSCELNGHACAQKPMRLVICVCVFLLRHELSLLSVIETLCRKITWFSPAVILVPASLIIAASRYKSVCMFLVCVRKRSTRYGLLLRLCWDELMEPLDTRMPFESQLRV